MTSRNLELIYRYVRAANYLSAAQIYLQDNFLLERELTFEDIKPRLLGHWGTCPGINFIYAHLQYIIKKHTIDMLFVLGPGHGFPALQANLFLEGTLQQFYPQATNNKAGVAYICKNFSWPYGFPSHTNPGTPGAILEGGELGYALSTAYGAILDNPDLFVACVIGDGEAETGATATAWHINKFIDPRTNGVVVPILHLNGYKISGPTIFGRMSDRQLKQLFSGYGYYPIIIQEPDIYFHMHQALELCYQKAHTIKQQALKSKSKSFYKYPMIILKTPKGWTGIKYLHDKKIEGNNLSHQVVAPQAKTDKKELKALEQWLKSYNFNELFNAKTGLHKDIQSIMPPQRLRMGNNKHAYGSEVYKPLYLPDVKPFAEDAHTPGSFGSSSMRRAGLYLNEVIKHNKNIRLFSPDEIYSNKLDAVLRSTHRAFVLPIKKWDQDLAASGHVIEMLSEHSLQGLAQGYILTGRHALFASYESFIEIVSSMADQYAKFLRIARQIPWRGDYASLTYILTSSGWRQEHNGFSHQNPAFISGLLEKHDPFIKVYFPPDGNSTLVVLKEALAHKNGITIIVAGKTVEPRWLTVELAQQALQDGIMIWDFASDLNPDLVFAAAGDYMTKEALAAIDLLKTHVPTVRLRFVNIVTLSGSWDTSGCLSSSAQFNYYFTVDKPVIFNFHGYPETLKALLFDQHTQRFEVYGYIEEGSTTTPFDMHVRNKTSRYHLVMRAADRLAKNQVISSHKAREINQLYTKKLEELTEYIKKYGVDPQEIAEWRWTRNILL